MSVSAVHTSQRDVARTRSRSRRGTLAHVRTLTDRLRELARQGDEGRHIAVRLLEATDRELEFTRTTRALFQDLLAQWGVATTYPIVLPVNDEPYWLRGSRPLAAFQSSPQLSSSADVVVIGAGLTGASAAYHLVHDTKPKPHVVVLEQGEPAGEASGRNGGNFQLLPENSVGMYEGLARERAAFLRKRYTGVPSAIVQAESERQASAVLGLSLRNRDLLKSIILHEQIACDFAPRGWLHVACSEEEEQGICEEVTLAAQYGQRIEIWSRRKIREEFGIESAFLGRFIPGDGTYHPYKYTCGLLQRAIDAGAELYTHVRVIDVTSMSADEHRVLTERGTIIARRVVAATNAFTSHLFPELSAIRPHQSQIQVTERAPDRARGRVVTCEDGPVFFNQPRDAAHGGLAPVLLGGGDDRGAAILGSRRRSRHVHERLLRLRERFYPELTGRPPSAEWVGTMGFTPDQLPAIGCLRPGVIVAAGYNGYGGSFTTAAGLACARMALTNEVPEWIPEDVFSPRRLLHEKPLFLTKRDSLWRIASALCQQLTVVNRQIAETIALNAGTPRKLRMRAAPKNVTTMMRVAALDTSPGSTIDAEELRALDAFSEMSVDDVRQLLAATTRCDLSRGRLVFREGDLGASCFILVSGQVDVSVKVFGKRHLLAQLSPGAIFGVGSFVSGEPRSASCSIHRDAVLAQLDRMAADKLLGPNETLALGFLGALNRSLTEALRAADRRLMQFTAETTDSA